ncbi:MAG: shikimate dehydrogenase [Candidatus Nanohaloarchaea archaeon]
MKTFGLIGYPVEHSLSPEMQETGLEELGINGRYCLYPVEDGDVEQALKGAFALGIDGLNVTIPHKQAVAESEMVETSELAERIGAVNTVEFTDNGIRGYNTDARGARRALERHEVDIEGSEAVVVGAGGASRAISFMLADSGAEVSIANRTYGKAEELAENVSRMGDASGHPLEDLEELVGKADILVNATSVGMEEDRSVVPAEHLHSDLTVLDAVYRPLETKLLRDAERKGAKTVDGAWMLLYQGTEAFEIWTGREAPVDAMNQALRDELE